MPMGGTVPGAAPAAAAPEVSPGQGPVQKGSRLASCHMARRPDFSHCPLSWPCISQRVLQTCVCWLWAPLRPAKGVQVPARVETTFSWGELTMSQRRRKFLLNSRT